MFCPKCGVELPDEYKFCPKCGFAIPQEVQQENDLSKQSETDISSNMSTEANVNESKFLQCPRCGSKRCQSHYKQDVTVQGGGYSCLSGGLGFLLAGPFGLLCGLCGRSTRSNTTNTLMWVCPDCGLEFREHQEMFNAIMISEKFSIGSLIALLFCDAILSDSVYLIIIPLVCTIMLAPICLWVPHYVYKNAVKNQFFVLTDQEKEQLTKTRIILYGVLVVMAFISCFLVLS